MVSGNVRVKIVDEKQLSQLINFTNLYNYRNRDYKIITLARSKSSSKSDWDILNVVVSPTDIPTVSYNIPYAEFLKDFKDTTNKYY